MKDKDKYKEPIGGKPDKKENTLAGWAEIILGEKKTKIKMLEGFSVGRSVPISKGAILEVIRFTENGDAVVWVDKMPSVWREMAYKTKPAKRMRVQIPSYMFEEVK